MRYPRSALIICLVITIAASVFQVFAQEKIFQFTPFDIKYIEKVYTVADGMPQNTATSMIQTRDGYIWITTFGGLTRYDGLKFKVFTTGNVPELANNRLTKLYEDEDGTIWIGSEDGDVIRYRSGVFKTIFKSQGPPEKAVTRILSDGRGRIWVGSGNGLKWINKETYEIKRFYSSDPEHSLSADVPQTVAVLAAADNKMYIGTLSGLFVSDLAGDDTPVRINAFIDETIEQMVSAPKGGVLVRTERSSARYQDGKISLISEDMSDPDFRLLNSTDEWHIIPEDDHLQKSTPTGIEKLITKEPLTGNITSILNDNEGNIWVGTDAGLKKFQRRNIWDFSLIHQGVKTSVNSVIEGSDGTMYIAYSRGLGAWKNGHLSMPLSTERAQSSIRSLSRDRDGNILFATIGSLMRLDPKTLKISEITEIPPFDKEIGVIFFDSKGGRWLGSKEAGVQYFRDGKRTVFDTSNGLAGNNVVRIVEGRDGVIWIATRNGLSRLDNGKIISYTTTEGLGGNHVRDVFDEGNGTIWIGTYGGGISRLRDGKIATLRLMNGLPEDVASSFLEDGSGNLWVLGNRGIYSVNIAEMNAAADGSNPVLSAVVYNENDGMPTAEGNGGNTPAAWKASDGKLWFALIEGAVAVDPWMQHRTNLPIHIEAVRSDGSQMPIDHPITVTGGQQDIEIEYTGITFIKPEFLRFQYMLEGLDRQWHDAGTRRTAYFHYLPPGEYTFHVRAANKEEYPGSTATIKIVVRPLFWQTWTAAVLLGLLVIVLVALAFYLGYRRLEKKRRKEREFAQLLINAHEEERKRIAADLHDGLGMDLLLIRNWITLMLKEHNIENDARTRLAEISQKASDALEETRSISRNLRPLHLARFGLTATLENLLETVQSSTDMNIDASIGNIDNIFSDEDELSIFRIVQECLNNVVKHSEARSVRIEISGEAEMVRIRVSDDGKGFVHDRTLRAGSVRSFGLESIEHRAESLNGTLHLSSSPDRGTEVVVKIKRNGMEQSKPDQDTHRR